MSSSADAQQRSGIWSHFGFSSAPRRRTSVSLPLRNTAKDPFEKPDRHNNSATPSSSVSMGDGKPAWMFQGQRARYVRLAGVIAFIILVFLYFDPNERARVQQYVESHSPFGDGGVASSSSQTTAKCTKPHSPSKPLIQYALMVDAGSTGSRIHVYRFNNCGASPELEEEIFEQTAKKEGGSGLSSYKEDAEGAAKSLDVLMEVALKHVPKDLQSCTPVSVKATAGLRKLGDKARDNILMAVRRRLETAFPFPVIAANKGGVEVMDGKFEGVYAWITTNYLLGKIGGPDESPTAAVLDLGGGSTQIVFQPSFKGSPKGGMPQKMEDGDHKYELKFGGRDFELYQHSYLDYGLMAARDKVNELVVREVYETHKPDKAWLSAPVLNPCFAPEMFKAVDVPLGDSHPLGQSVRVNMTGPPPGSPAQCRALAEKALRKEAECKIVPCAFNGVHQPSFEQTFAREDVYLLSFFYDRTKPLGMPDSFTLQELRDLTARVCEGGKAWELFKSIEGALEELNDRPETCLDLNFMLALLHTGYGIPLDREVKVAKKINGNELGWCLGASLPLLSQESGWQCRIQEVSK